ncbi:ribosome rescue protein RqcH [Haloplanus sp.]|uniref:ribosome rescue protein RqcH n=1 Tax=Haloplanus sp. TaxID=1961696 RepID=UPI0026384BDE|nr:ribosome rescue protein RqcH [Haloplanus sp.]
MDAKRELTSVDLAALVAELGRYEGAKVDKVYLYDDDLLRFRMRDFDRGRVELLIEVGEVKRAHVADPERVADAPERPPNFAMMLRNRLSGADFAGVSQYEFDRILRFEFERDDEDTTVVAELFGQGNAAVLDESGEVVRSLETVRLKSRTVAPGSQYGFPDSRVHPLSIGYDAFVRRMDESNTDVVRTLATQLNFGGLYGEEVCARAGVEKTLDIADAGENEYEALYDAIGRIADRLETGDVDPRVYLDDEDRVVDVTPFPLEERADLSADGFDSFNAALDDYFDRLERDPDEEATGTDRPDFEAEVAKQQRIIEQQENAIEGFEEQAAAERDRAEALYANYDLVDEVISTVRAAREESVPWDDIETTLAEGAERGIPAAEAVVDIDAAEGTVTVNLDGTRVTVDPSTGVEKNADRLYTEAKRVEEKKEGALEAIENTREELAAVKRRRDEWEAVDADDETENGDGTENDDETENVDWLSRSSVPIKQPEHWYEEFRWFHTSDGFLVIGGRNADENEAIVKKYMERNDRFFHAQAHGGPVTLLKATGPSEKARDVDFPDSSLREAAQFAVSYSSVWKDGRFAGDAYMVDPDQVSKTPESGEYIEKGGFVIRGDRTYFRDVGASAAVGIQCEPETRVIGGPASAVEPRAATSLRLEPGKFAQNDAAKRCYRRFKKRFADDSFVRKVASPDRIQEFLPAGRSSIVEG